MMMPVSKPSNFRAGFSRLMAELKPESALVFAVFILAVISVVLAILGPKIIGEAVNTIFAGAIGNQMATLFPQSVGMTHDQVVEALRAAGQTPQADMIAAMPTAVPGVGIDLNRLYQFLGLEVAVSVASSICSWGQGYSIAGVAARAV